MRVCPTQDYQISSKQRLALADSPSRPPCSGPTPTAIERHPRAQGSSTCNRGLLTAVAQSDAEHLPQSPMDIAEDGGVEPAQTPMLAGQQEPPQRAGHETLNMGTSAAEAMETSSPERDPLHHIGYAHSLADGSALEMSAAEMTDTDATSRAQGLTDDLPNIHYKSSIHENAQTPMHALPPDFIAAEQSHAQLSQFLSQREEDGADELQDETHRDIDSAYDADSAYDGDSVWDNDTETLASFITNYRWENGRRYHAYSDGAYWVRIQSMGR